MRHRPLLVAPVVIALASALAPAAGARAAGPARKPPRLVVLVAVDQLRADYIDQFGKHWKHGLKRLVEGGAHFRRAAYPYLNTVTCPGHATLGTGAYPLTHGMILNAWYDRAARKVVSCTEDPTSPLVTYGETPTKPVGDSARPLRVPTLADAMKAQLSPRPRVVSLSMKARSAITLGGRRPDAVTWWESRAFVTAAAFARRPVPFVKQLIDASPVTADLDKVWTRALDPAAYRFPDDVPEERPPIGWARTFPHPLRLSLTRPLPPPEPGQSTPVLTPYSLWATSPEADRYLAALARGALAALKLGQGRGTDFLAVSFSVLDGVGHAFGPRSQEVEDVLARLDVTLGELLDDLDRQVGRDGYVLALSADHGVAVYPEQLRAEGKDAGRISMTRVREHLGKALEGVLGPGPHVASTQYTDLYLAPGVMDRLRARPEALAAAREALRAVPGVAQVFATDELRDRARARAGGGGDPIWRAAALSHFPARSGDLVIVPKANWLATSTGTTHGTLHEYDSRVPVILWGAGIKPGAYDREVSPADVAPTLAALCGVKLSQADGKPLAEALDR